MSLSGLVIRCWSCSLRFRARDVERGPIIRCAACQQPLTATAIDRTSR